MPQLSTGNRNPKLESIGADLVRRLSGVWRGGRGMCLCPAHDDHDPSLSVRVGERALLFKCFAGCDRRDVIRAILRIDEKALRKIEARGSACGWGPELLWRRRLALNLWQQSKQLSGTPGEIYLRRRSLTILPSALRYNRRVALGGGKNVTFRPAMITAVHDLGRFVAVQRTFFDLDEPRRARDLPNPRRMLGRPGRGAVMLAPADNRLGLAEGVETAMSAMMLFDIPVWATLGSERLHRIAIPDSVTHLTLFPDNDLAGEIGAANAERAYAVPGRQIDTEWPPFGYKDWNDVLRQGGKRVGDWERNAG